MSEKRENDKSAFGEDLSRRDFLRWVASRARPWASAA